LINIGFGLLNILTMGNEFKRRSGALRTRFRVCVSEPRGLV